jgi:uncharacterized membrane protein YphA (DoxX/SURF4 family)
MEVSTSAPALPRQFELPAWKTLLSHAGAVFIAFLFLLSGVYKALDPYQFASLAKNLLVPEALTLPLAVALAIGETTAGVLILIPRFRRWGAYLAGGLLIAFIGYMGINYAALAGQDCSCFPPINILGYEFKLERSVGPEFFYGDLAFLAAAAIAGWWAKPSQGLRNAAVILGSVAVFAGVSFGVAYANMNGSIRAPESIVVDGKEFSLQDGKQFIFFYNPTCLHCIAAAKHMARMAFNPEVTVIAVPLDYPQWAQDYLKEDGFDRVAHTSLDVEKLRAVFQFTNYPYGVVIENGRQIGTVPNYDDEDGGAEPATTLRALGVIE